MTTARMDYGGKKRNSDKNSPSSDHLNGNNIVATRRTRIPNKPNYPLSLWSLLKNCIGKDLSKIALPVNFSEPLSMLQR
jgi:oxysterol-binding protein 1